MAATTFKMQPKESLYPAGPQAVEKFGDGEMLLAGSDSTTAGFRLGIDDGGEKGGVGRDVLGSTARGGIVAVGVGSTGTAVEVGTAG